MRLIGGCVKVEATAGLAKSSSWGGFRKKGCEEVALAGRPFGRGLL